MDAVPISHPTDKALKAYGLGKLDDASAEAVNEHLKVCAECRMRVAGVSADSFLGRFQKAQGSGKSLLGQSLPGGIFSQTGGNAPSPPPASTPAPAVASPPATNNSQTVASLRPPHNPASEAVPDTAIAAAMPSEAITRQKESTAQIVDATENSLKNLNRPLNDEEKAMRTQIQSYLQQSRKATSDGDFERAFNLAKKAQLLADALVKK